MIYLDNAASTPCLDTAWDAMRDANNEWSNVHRGLHHYADATTNRYEEARRQVAGFIGADPEEIVFTSGTTDSLNMVAYGLGLLPGDTIVATRMDHHSNLVPWQEIAQRRGCHLRIVPVRDGELDLDYLERGMREQPRVVTFPAVSNVLGTINPAPQIIKMAHKVGAITVMDAAQSVPHFQHDVRDLGVDFMAFSGHKMHGPTGVGVLYGRQTPLKLLKPTRYGGGMVSDVSRHSFRVKPGYQKLEAGTPPIQQAIGLGAACQYWIDIGMGLVYQRVGALTQQAYCQLEAMPGVHVLGPPKDKRIGIVSFTVDGIHAHDVAALLGEYGVAVRAGHHCALPLHQALGIPASTRASFSHFNKWHEINFLTEALVRIQNRFPVTQEP